MEMKEFVKKETLKEKVIKLHLEGKTVGEILDALHYRWDTNVRKILRIYKLEQNQKI